MDKEKLKKVFADVFGEKPEKCEVIDSAHYTKWDSIAHLRLIMAVEREFGVQFETEDIPKLTSFSLLAQKLLETESK